MNLGLNDDLIQVMPQNDNMLFQADKEIYSIQQLYSFLEDITEAETIKTKNVVIKLYNIKEKIHKIDILKVEFQKWFREFLVQTSAKFSENHTVINALSEIFYILFPIEDAETIFISLMDQSLESCAIAIKIFGFYIQKKLKLEPFDHVIRKIFKFLQNRDLRPICLSIVRESLTNSHYLYESLTLSNKQLLFLLPSDDPISISNGLEICKQMILSPCQKFPPNGYEFFLSEVTKAIIFFSHEKIISDMIILLISEISIQLKKLEFFYLMEPNEILFSWLSSIYFISERFVNQNQAINNNLSDILKLINNLIEFWLFPPNLLKIQSIPDFINWKGNFVKLCMSFFLRQSNSKQMKIIVEIMENSSFCDLLGQYFSKDHDFKKIVKHQIKKHPKNIGNCVLISIFASVLKQRELVIGNNEFKKNDIHALYHVVQYYINFPLVEPETVEQFLISDAFSRLLQSFTNSYINTAKISINDKIMQNISILYMRTLFNLQANDESKKRLSRGIDAIMSLPLNLVLKLYERTEFVPIISSLRFKFIDEPKYKKEVKKLFDHLFSIHNATLDQSLLAGINFAHSTDEISPNIFVAVRSLFKSCTDEDHYQIMQIVGPIIQKSLNSQVLLEEVAKTIKTISKKVFPPKCSSLSPDTINYVKMIINLVHLLLGQFRSALPDEEIVIATKILDVFNNIMIYQPINFGILVFYGDFFFHQIIDGFFSVLCSKDIGFFCQDTKFILSLIQFIDTFIDSGLVLENLFNHISIIFINIFDLHKIGKDILSKLSAIMFYLFEKGYKLDGVLECIMKYKISEEPNLGIFNKLLILLCRIRFDVFSKLLNGQDTLLSDDAKELLQYIFSELSSENFELSTQFENDFNDCFEMIKPALISSLFNDNDGEEEEEEDIQL